MKLKFFLIGFLLCLLSGCATSLREAQRMAGDGHPDEYYEGFSAGCDSGLFSGGVGFYYPHRDKDTYTSNSLYNSGWSDGKILCYEKSLKLEKERQEYLRQRAIENYLYEQKT